MQTEKSFMHVTNRQGARFAELAREAGVSREEFSLFFRNEEKRKKFFDELKNGDNWFEKLQAEASKIGARVHLIKLKVDYSKSHNEQALIGGPQTESDCYVLKVADLYKPSENKVADEVIVLLNCLQDGRNYKEIMKWALKNELEKSIPLEVFAIGEQFPKLNYELGLKKMYLVETTGCSFDGYAEACCVYWFDTIRMSNTTWRGIANSDEWFAFRKKVSPK